MDNICVLDVGSSKLSVLIGKQGLNNNLNVLASTERKYAGYYNGEFVEPENLQDDVCAVLSEAEQNIGKRIGKLFVGIPADFCICRTKTFMQNFGEKRKIIESDIMEIYQHANELKNNDDFILITCSPIYFVLDDGRKCLNPIGEKTSRINGEISYIYAEKSFISTINVILRKFGIKSVEYLSSTLSENLYLLDNKNKDESYIVVDCGYISTSVSISKGNGLTLLNSFSVGGGQIVGDLSECLQITYAEAEELKKQIILSVIPELAEGYEIKKPSKSVLIPMNKANDVVCARLDMICSLINKCLQNISKTELYKMNFYLTGGGICFIKGAKDYLSKYFGVNIEILNPQDLQMTKPNYSSALGLLDAAIKQSNKRKVNKFIKFLSKLTKR